MRMPDGTFWEVCYDAEALFAMPSADLSGHRFHVESFDVDDDGTLRRDFGRSEGD